jgi:hypothetical protein
MVIQAIKAAAAPKLEIIGMKSRTTIKESHHHYHNTNNNIKCLN